MIELGVVQSVQQMDRARAGRREAYTRIASVFGVRRRHERRLLFVANLDEIQLAVGAVARGDETVDPVARIPEDASDSPCDETGHEEVARCVTHDDSGSQIVRHVTHLATIALARIPAEWLRLPDHVEPRRRHLVL